MSALRFSILELLALILFPGLAIAAVRAGGIFISLALLAGLLWFVALAVSALFGQGSWRAFSGGFVVAAGIYTGLLFYFGESELDLAGRLPTTRLLKPLNEATTTYTYIDGRTGAPLSDAEVEASRTTGSRSLISVRLWPEREDFMLIGHLLVGSLLGYLAGKGAVVLERRAERARAATQS